MHSLNCIAAAVDWAFLQRSIQQILQACPCLSRLSISPGGEQKQRGEEQGQKAFHRNPSFVRYADSFFRLRLRLAETATRVEPRALAISFTGRT